MIIDNPMTAMDAEFDGKVYPHQMIAERQREVWVWAIPSCAHDNKKSS